MLVGGRARVLISLWLFLSIALLLPAHVHGSTPAPTKNGLSVGDIVCIVIGTVLGATLLCILLYLLAFGRPEPDEDTMIAAVGTYPDNNAEQSQPLIPNNYYGPPAQPVPSKYSTVQPPPPSVPSLPPPSQPQYNSVRPQPQYNSVRPQPQYNSVRPQPQSIPAPPQYNTVQPQPQSIPAQPQYNTVQPQPQSIPAQPTPQPAPNPSIIVPFSPSNPSKTNPQPPSNPPDMYPSQLPPLPTTPAAASSFGPVLHMPQISVQHSNTRVHAARRQHIHRSM
jgi:hypothetical protein